MNLPRTFIWRGSVAATAVAVLAVPAHHAGATEPPPADPDATQDQAAFELVEWGASEGIALSIPACTKPNAVEPGQAITCYATDETGAVLAFVTAIPASGEPFTFDQLTPVGAPDPGTPATAPGVEPPAGYPGTETTAPGEPGEPAGTANPAEPTGSFVQSEDPIPPGEVLPAPEPDIGPAGNFASPIPVGQAADVPNGWTMTVNSVQPNASGDVAAADPESEPAPAGWQYVTVNVTVGYEGDPNPEVQSVMVVYGITGGNTLYNQTGYAFYDAMLTDADTPAPGATATGDVVFLLPADQVDSLVVYAKRYRAFDAPYVFFATQ